MTIGEIMICLQKKGIEATRSIPIVSDDPHETFTVVEGNNTHEFSQREFLGYSKQEGCYQEPGIRFDHLEITENITAQVENLSAALKWERARLEACLRSLARKDSVALTNTARGRRIGLAPSADVLLTDPEIELYEELRKYRPHI